MKVKLVIKPLYELPDGESYIPKYATNGSAGFDFRANITENVILKAGEFKLIKTGLFTSFQKGYELQVRPRSGLALKYGISVLNAPGTVDADYTNEIGIILVNFSDKDFTIEPGMRIEHGVFAKYEQAEWEIVVSLEDTERKGGFGSTGV